MKHRSMGNSWSVVDSSCHVCSLLDPFAIGSREVPLVETMCAMKRKLVCAAAEEEDGDSDNEMDPWPASGWG